MILQKLANVIFIPKLVQMKKYKIIFVSSSSSTLTCTLDINKDLHLSRDYFSATEKGQYRTQKLWRG